MEPVDNEIIYWNSVLEGKKSMPSLIGIKNSHSKEINYQKFIYTKPERITDRVYTIGKVESWEENKTT